MFNRVLLTILGLLAFYGSVQAHQLKVFAHAKPDQITGEVYFSGGQKLENARVSLTTIGSADDILRTRTNAEGGFSFPVMVRQDYRITANSGDGHVAHWDVRKSEVILSEPEPDGPQISHPDTPAPLNEQRSGNLKTLIKSAVSSQIAPLRAELQKMQDERRMQDILGGIGYIMGLAGLSLFWFSRRRGSKP